MQQVQNSNPQDYFLEANGFQNQKEQERKTFLASVWQRLEYYWSIAWPYVYRLFSFIIYEVIKVTKGIFHIALSQIRQKD